MRKRFSATVRGDFGDFSAHRNGVLTQKIWSNPFYVFINFGHRKKMNFRFL